jgi:hypothetical protein
MEQMDMEHMAFDPFGAVNEPPQHRDLRMDLHTKYRFESLHGRHLISDRTNAANTRRDVGHVLDGPSPQ